jgi:hypothetical protein
MEQGFHSVPGGDLLDRLHDQLIAVHRHVRGREDRSNLELIRSHFVVLVLAATPTFQSSKLSSRMKRATRSMMAPK